MVKPRKRNLPKYDAVRFELDQLMQDACIRRIEGIAHNIKGKHAVTLVQVVPIAFRDKQIAIVDYPRLQRFIRTTLRVLLLRDIVERFVLRSLALHKVILKDHLSSDYVRYRVRAGGCVSFDSGPDRNYRHITFGVFRRASTTTQ